jgi:hypothetical protein
MFAQTQHFRNDALTRLMSTDLNDLVEHTQWVPADMSLETLIDRFRSAIVSYVAVLKGDSVVGIVSPESI